MKVIVVGATGVLGKAVVAELEPRHEIVGVSHSKGEIKVDITDLNSIRSMFERIGPFDALVSTTGAVHFGPLEEITQDQWHLGIENKLMGQMNLVMEGLKHVRDNGSFTLTSGIISRDPIRYGAAACMINRAVEGFVAGSAIEMPRGIRLNAVSPTLVEESVESFGPYFHGFEPVPAAKAALGYAKSVDGLRTGQTFEVTGAV
ncbi:MAG: short chain dehydrogenase [Gemmatimonadetes bacterium]|nr:short chain dehydrogenase [Gemmatimonadota bacterium]